MRSPPVHTNPAPDPAMLLSLSRRPTARGQSPDAGGPRPAAGDDRGILKPTPRYPLLDLLRVVAMLDILAIHLTGAYLLGGAGLPAFIIISVALAVRRPVPPPLGEVARKRAARVLLPWVFWCGFYGLLLLYRPLTDPAVAVGEGFESWMLVAGTKIHLWFLPFIFAAEVAAVATVRGARGLAARWLVVAALAASAVAVVIAGRTFDRWDAAGTLEGRNVGMSWLFGIASVTLGVAVGRTLSMRGRAAAPGEASRPTSGLAAPRLLWAFALVAFVAVLVLRLTVNPAYHAVWLGWRQALALLLVVSAVQLTGTTSPRLTRIGALTMGVYLLHGLVHATLYDRLLSLIWDDVPYLYAVLNPGPVRIAVTWLATAAGVAMLRRWRPARYVL